MDDPRTVERVFKDFKGRRAGIIQALTTDVREFRRLCVPDKENLCLYGHPNEHWEVNLPAEEVPPEIPEPVLGINFARDGMRERDWLSLVAVHSDSWLLSVAFYFGAKFGFDKADRKRLFNMVNELPTVFEVVLDTIKKQENDNSISNNSSNRFNSNFMRGFVPRVKFSSDEPEDEEEEEGAEDEDKEDEDEDEESVEDEDEEDEDEDEEEQGETQCGACDRRHTSEFWICCDICERWFHGKCVRITPAMAEHIKQYNCPDCICKKRARALKLRK